MKLQLDCTPTHQSVTWSEQNEDNEPALLLLFLLPHTEILVMLPVLSVLYNWEVPFLLQCEMEEEDKTCVSGLSLCIFYKFQDISLTVSWH